MVTAGLMGLVLYTDWFPGGTGNLKPGAPALAGAELPALAFKAGPGCAVMFPTGAPSGGGAGAVRDSTGLGF